MRRIFSKLLYEIEEERNTMLVTVIADRGSAPRGALPRSAMTVTSMVLRSSSIS